MAWQKTKNIINLEEQLNARWPNRDKTSDGTIGDLAHQNESSSGHNPDDTPGSRPAWDGDSDNLQEVRAKDVDSDLRDDSCDMQDVVDHLIHLPGFSSVCRYLIYNRYWWHANNGWARAPYTGASAHTEHLHYEGAWSQAADNNSTFDFKFEEVGNPMDWSDKPWTSSTPISVAAAVQNTHGWAANIPALFANVTALQTTLASVLANVVADDGEKAAILADAATKHAQVMATVSAAQAAIANVDDELFSKLSDPTTPDQETANVILTLIAGRPGVLAALKAS